MRNSVITSLTFGFGALLAMVSFGASATIIHVGLKDSAGSTLWTSPVIGDPHGTVSLSGWEYDNHVWNAAKITYKNGSAAETGEGVACNDVTQNNNACGQKEIGATPWQMLDLDISQLTGWSSLTINLSSVNATGHGSGGGEDGDETGYLVGAKCMVGGYCTTDVLSQSPLASCTNFGNVPGALGTCSFTFTSAELLGLGVTDIWVTPSLTDPDGSNNANILLGGDLVLNAVPEPTELSIFGFGLLLLGLFVGLRRRQMG